MVGIGLRVAPPVGRHKLRWRPTGGKGPVENVTFSEEKRLFFQQGSGAEGGCPLFVEMTRRAKRVRFAWNRLVFREFCGKPDFSDLRVG